MSEAQAASALERLYEDTSVRDELMDADATVLLEWGAARVNLLAQQNLDDSHFEAAYLKLTRVMARVNRFVGKRHAADQTQQYELLQRLQAVAVESGYSCPQERLAAFAQQHSALDDSAAIRALTAVLEGRDSAAASTPPAPPNVAPPPAPPPASSPLNVLKNLFASKPSEGES
ncbi:MAG: hypothetical protein HXY40_08970 [Chloroflexi bacterium]|nr:hypothetical protein [Chloroflexota bacterium]